MEKLEEQIHLRNIVTCLNEIGDYCHYLSYERFVLDRELKEIILKNLSLAAQEAKSLYNKGFDDHGLKYLVGFDNISETELEDYAIYNLLQNDLDFLSEMLNTACNNLAVEEQENLVPHTI